MKGINEITADSLKHWDVQVETVNGWKLARPIGRGGLLRRLSKAWKVFKGEADILIWHRQ